MAIYDFGGADRIVGDLSNSMAAVSNSQANDVDYVNNVSEEATALGGNEVQVYKVVIDQTHDGVWNENADPVYLNPESIMAFYKPSEIQLELTKWGVDSKAPILITFLYKDVIEKFNGKLINADDVIKIKKMGDSLYPQHYRVSSSTPSGVFKYQWIYLKCFVNILSADYAIRTSGDMDQSNTPTSPGIYYDGQ